MNHLKRKRIAAESLLSALRELNIAGEQITAAIQNISNDTGDPDGQIAHAIETCGRAVVTLRGCQS